MSSDSERKDKLTAELDRLISYGCRILYHSDYRAQLQDFMGKTFNLQVDEDGEIHREPLKKNAEPTDKKPPAKKRPPGCLAVFLSGCGVLVGLVALVVILAAIGVLDDDEADQSTVATPRPTVEATRYFDPTVRESTPMPTAAATPYFNPNLRNPISSAGRGPAEAERIAAANAALWELAQDGGRVKATLAAIATTPPTLEERTAAEGLCQKERRYLTTLSDKMGRANQHIAEAAGLMIMTAADPFLLVDEYWNAEFVVAYTDAVLSLGEITKLDPPDSLRTLHDAASRWADLVVEALYRYDDAIVSLDLGILAEAESMSLEAQPLAQRADELLVQELSVDRSDC